MFKNRVIPCLLLKDKGLVKTVKFNNPGYVGDPMNAVKIFNEKKVDELIFLDIAASREKRKPGFDLIADIASECFMPFCYGGGITTLEEIKNILFLGAEKVSISSYAVENPGFVKESSVKFGAQSIVVSINVKKDLSGKYKVYNSSTDKLTGIDPVEFALKMESFGAGELFLNSVDRDGTFEGYDLELIKQVARAVAVPVIACGGAGSAEDFAGALDCGASAVAAGSLFVFYGKHRAVLINYLPQDEILKFLK